MTCAKVPFTTTQTDQGPIVSAGSRPAHEVVFLDGFAPGLSDAALLTLREALEDDDDRLMQGGTTSPPPLMAVQDWYVEAACAIGLCGWLGDGLSTVGEVEEYFARACFDADQRLGESAACRWFTNWWDDEPRDVVMTKLLRIVDEAITSRNKQEIAHGHPSHSSN